MGQSIVWSVSVKERIAKIVDKWQEKLGRHPELAKRSGTICWIIETFDAACMDAKVLHHLAELQLLNLTNPKQMELEFDAHAAPKKPLHRVTGTSKPTVGRRIAYSAVSRRALSTDAVGGMAYTSPSFLGAIRLPKSMPLARLCA
jgi:hypothetical protein